MLASLCRNLTLHLCSCQSCSGSAISALKRRNLMLNLLNGSNLLVLAKSYVVSRNLAIFFLDYELIDRYNSFDVKICIIEVHQVAGLKCVVEALDCAGRVSYGLIVLPCHEKLVNLRLIDIPCVVILVKERNGVLKELQRCGVYIRIRKSDSGKNEMVTILDRVVLVWEPQFKSIVLDSFDSKSPSSVNLG